MRTQVSTLIDRPVEDIFDCVASTVFIRQLITTQAENNYTDTEIRQVSEGAIGVGTKFLQSNKSKEHFLEATIEVIEYKRPRVVAFIVKRGSNTTKIKWVFKPASNTTLTTFLLESIHRGWFMRILTFIAFNATKNSKTGSVEYMQKLKKYIEEQC